MAFEYGTTKRELALFSFFSFVWVLTQECMEIMIESPQKIDNVYTLSPNEIGHFSRLYFPLYYILCI